MVRGVSVVWIDYAILAVIGLSSLISLIRGFVKEALSLVTWFAAFFVASNFYGDLVVYITSVPKWDAYFTSISLAGLFYLYGWTLGYLQNTNRKLEGIVLVKLGKFLLYFLIQPLIKIIQVTSLTFDILFIYLLVISTFTDFKYLKNITFISNHMGLMS